MLAALTLAVTALTAEYFVNSESGADTNSGTSSNSRWKSLAPLQAIAFQPEDNARRLMMCSLNNCACENVLASAYHRLEGII